MQVYKDMLELEIDYPQLAERLSNLVPSDIDTFQEAVGGDVYVVKEKSELGTILDADGVSVLAGGRNFDVFDSWADGFTEIVLITNNSGGNTYFVPNYLLFQQSDPRQLELL